METFAASKSDRHPTDLAMLRGARLVTAQETEEGGAWNETRIKALTGGDSITARFMRQDFFTFNPTFKLVIAGNHKPILRSVDDANRLQYHPLHQQAYGRRQAPAGKTQGGVAGHTALGDRGMRRMA
jgi:putative DNA primase/helicase